MIPMEPTKLNDKQRFDLIKTRYASSTKPWLLIAERKAFRIEADYGNGPEPLLEFAETCSYPDRDFILEAQSDVKFLLDLVDRSIAKVKELKALLSPNYAAQASMLCKDPAFKKFMAEKMGLEPPLTDDRVATRLRSILSIASKADLNNNDPAAERWKNLHASFETWRRHG